MSEQDWSAADGGCLTVVTGSAISEILGGFCAEPFEPIARSSPDFVPWSSVVVAEGGGSVLLWEAETHQGTELEVVRRASLGGRAASAFWNVNAVTRIVLAEKGEVFAAGEAVNPVFAVSGSRPDLLQSLMDDLEFSMNDEPVAGMISIVSSFVGQPVALDVFADATWAYPVAPFLWSLSFDPQWRETALETRLADSSFGLGDSDLARLLMDCEVADRRRFVQWCVERALAENDLGDVPEFMDALSQCHAGRFGALEPAAVNSVRRLIAIHEQLTNSDEQIRRQQAAAAAMRRSAGLALYELAINLDPDSRLAAAAFRSKLACLEGRDAWVERARAYLRTSL